MHVGCIGLGIMGAPTAGGIITGGKMADVALGQPATAAS